MRYYFSFFLTLLTTAISSLSAQVDFKADTLDGCGTLTVKFTPISTDPITKTLWEFGDGRISQDPYPTSTYTKSGVYTVKLTLNGSSVIKINYITIRPMPNAHFTFKDSVKSGPYIVSFYAAQQDSLAYKYYYNWSFSDNTVETIPVLVHQFDTAGLYYAYLTVTDSFGCINTYKHLIRVSKKIIVPNVFTPNDDNKNDVLEIETDGKTKYQFMVFSATGMLVYKTESLYIRWGGENLSGVRVNQGVYYYTIESLEPANPFTQSGFIYLLR